jgi:AcrR family transcriptional regulator
LPTPKPASEPPPPAKRRRRRSTEELTSRILRAAADEFKENGYVGATTAAIAQKAEVTEAQLFRYFGSKSNLFREAIFTPFYEQLQTFMAEHGQANDMVAIRSESADYITALCDLLRENVGYIKTLIVAHAYEGQQPGEVDAIGSLQKYFERGEAEFKRRQHTKMDPKLLVRVSFAAVLGCVIFNDWLFPPGLADEEQIQTAIKDFVIEGIQGNRI